MEMMPGLEDLLAKARMSKADLARRLGVTANTITNWKVMAPKYAIAYLEMFIELQRYKP